MLHWMPTLAQLSDTHRADRDEVVAIRRARDADRAELDRLAALDCARAPRGTVLVGSVDGEAWAALSLDDGHVVADPFRPSGAVVALLRARAAHVAGARGDRRWTLRGRLAPKRA